MIGKVLEVFIPTENNIDIMNSDKIGFKIVLEDDEEIEIIEKQCIRNANIFKNDKVIISFDEEDNYVLELYRGEDNGQRI